MTQCLQCNKETNNPKFCCKSCAAKYNNKGRIRSLESKQKTSQTILNKKIIGIKIKRIYPKYSKISWCSICKSLIYGKKKICSSSCRTEMYRRLTSSRKVTRNKSNVLYKGIWLGSSFELTVAKSLDEANVYWIKPKSLPYIDSNGKKHSYFPDFYLPLYDVYLDPKNDFLIQNPNPYHGYSDSDKILWCSKQNSKRIIILDKNHLTWDKIQMLL